ncbi:putative Protein kinase domain [Paratrimastix pyriformis]|uniref:Protein kinase domain-containing protein n=1 Tax=Paratrimastix pyriformis TaxID=342808 RepID=A0ABQ8US43_9EUKA|nr:putative Protein kinase domain [Paratrimastix pyriformis]
MTTTCVSRSPISLKLEQFLPVHQPSDDYFSLLVPRGKLGDGTASEVFLFECPSTAGGIEKIAVKVMRASRDSLNEIYGLLRAGAFEGRHPHIVQAYWAKFGRPEVTSPDFHSFEWVSVALELADSDILKVRNRYESVTQLPVEWSRWMWVRVLEAVNDLHTAGVYHNDIKAENILLVGQFPNYRPKVADFSLAVASPMPRAGSTGTHFYNPPEVAAHLTYLPEKVDTWELGVLLIVMLCKAYPWDNALPKDPAFGAYMQTGMLPPHVAQYLDYGAQDLIRRCLTPDAHSRPATAELLRHPWVLGLPMSKPVPTATITEVFAPAADPTPSEAPETPSRAELLGEELEAGADADADADPAIVLEVEENPAPAPEGTGLDHLSF